MKNLILLCAALAGPASAAITYDTLLLRQGNLWVYSIHTSQGGQPSTDYDGIRRMTLDSLKVFPDRVELRVIQSDSGLTGLKNIPPPWTGPDPVESKSLDTTWYSFAGEGTNTVPLFMLGKSLSASNGRYVYRGDTLRSRRDASNDCRNASSLNIEGIGLAYDGFGLTCGTLRQSAAYRLLAYNGDAFDSVLFKPVSIFPSRVGRAKAAGFKGLRLERGAVLHGSEDRVFNLRGEQVRRLRKEETPKP